MEEHSYHIAAAPKPVGLYPHARRVGNLLFLSGVGPRDPETNEVPGGVTLDQNGNILDYDFEAQVHSVFRNVRTILESAGSRFENLIDITVFLINMRRDFELFNKLYADYFRNHPAPPCRTTIEISRLPTPIAIELKCIATIGEGET